MEQILIWAELSHGISTGSQVSWAASKCWAPQGTVELPPTESRRGRFRQERKQTRVADINCVCQVIALAWEMSEIDSQSAKKAHFPFLIYLCKHFSSVHAKKEKISLKICLSKSHISSAPSTWLCFVLLHKHLWRANFTSFLWESSRSDCIPRFIQDVWGQAGRLD